MNFIKFPFFLITNIVFIIIYIIAYAPKRYNEITNQAGKYSILYLTLVIDDFDLLKIKLKKNIIRPIVKVYILYFFNLISKSFL